MGPERATVAPRGFTLLELLVTLFIIVVAVGVVVPTIGKSADTVRVRAEVAAFAAFFRHAREQAITRRQSERVVVEPDAHRLTLVVGEDTIRETRDVPARLAIEPATPGALVVRFEPEGTSSGGAFRLSSGGTTYRVTVDAATGRVRSVRESAGWGGLRTPDREPAHPGPGGRRGRQPASDAGCARLHAARDADRARDRGRAPRDRLRRHARCPRRVAPGRGPRRGLSARARRRALAGAHGGPGVSLRGSARRGAGVGALVLRERHASRVRRAVVARTVSHPDRIRRGRGRVRRERGASRARGPTARAAEPEPVHRCGGGLPRPDGHGAQAPVHGRERRVAGRVGRSERQDHAARRPHHARHHAQRADRTAAATDGLASGEGRMRAERGFALIVGLLVMASVGVAGAEFAYSTRLAATAVRAYKDRILASHLAEAAFAQAGREMVAESTTELLQIHGVLETPAIFWGTPERPGLVDVVTVKTPGQTVNLNTATPCAMQALGLSDAKISEVMQQRHLAPYATLPSNLGVSGVGVTTQTFRIEAQGIVGGRVDARLTAIVQKPANATPPTVQILEWSSPR